MRVLTLVNQFPNQTYDRFKHKHLIVVLRWANLQAYVSLGTKVRKLTADKISTVIGTHWFGKTNFVKRLQECPYNWGRRLWLKFVWYKYVRAMQINSHQIQLVLFLFEDINLNVTQRIHKRRKVWCVASSYTLTFRVLATYRAVVQYFCTVFSQPWVEIQTFCVVNQSPQSSLRILVDVWDNVFPEGSKGRNVYVFTNKNNFLIVIKSYEHLWKNPWERSYWVDFWNILIVLI